MRKTHLPELDSQKLDNEASFCVNTFVQTERDTSLFTDTIYGENNAKVFEIYPLIQVKIAVLLMSQCYL
jgi:hypothetical protein